MNVSTKHNIWKNNTNSNISLPRQKKNSNFLCYYTNLL